jgi:hypothetical protein
LRDHARLTTLAVAILLLALVGGDAAAAKKPTARSALKGLVTQTNKLPAAAAPAKKRRALKRLAVHAKRSARRKPCASVNDLNAYRRVLGTVRIKKKRSRATRRLTALGPASLNASRLLLASKKTKRCGGGSKARPGDNPKVRVVGSDGRRLRVKVQMPQLGFAPAEGGGKAWTKLGLPNSDAPGTPGTPGIPVVSDVLAIPDGAKVGVKVNDVNKIAMDGVDVFPAQPDPVDDDTPAPNFLEGPFANAPFQLNSKAYNKNSPVPAKPADADSLGQFRDLNVGALQIPSAQYNADKKKLSVITSIDLTVIFKGGSHTFSDLLGDPWEESQRKLGLTFLNRNVIRRIDIREILRRCGEQMMVITNPSTLAAANSLAAARSAAGIRTRVFQTGTGTGFIGTTATEIQTAIRNELAISNFLCIRPSYVTIIGDDDLVPTFPGINGIPSDLQYSMKDDVDELPDLAVGRIIGNDQAAVQTAVDKIVNYENSPPFGLWRRHATIAAQFQDDDNNGQENRTFIQFAETVRNGLVGHGETVDRIYGESPGNNPQKFNDGTDLPADLKKPTFGWNGTGADVSAAWNDGRFMVIHRDHGYSDGWGTPGYHTADVQALTNTILPVLLSVNCSSGAYDYDETSFAGEALVKANGGAVGVFGDTRDSPTWHNTQLALGFVDGMLPFVLPSEGPATRQRTGNALINGKMRLAGLAPPATDGSTRNELYLWHYFGDPTMQMWGASSPFVLDPSQFSAVFQKAVADPPPGDPPPYWVIVQVPPGLTGETLSLLRNGEVVGKATITGDTVRIPASLANDASGKLQVATEPDGSPPVVFDVKSQPTTLSQQCPAEPVGAYGNSEPFTVSGHLDPALTGATIKVKYTTASSSTFERTVTTDANGNWSDTIVAQDEAPGEFGDWKVQARFDGDAQHQASTAPECTVVVFNDG